jgi:transcriptional regulator with XRE-family HTH domain
MNSEKIGNFIKEIRKKEGLTQEKFAAKYGVTYQAVSKWENGKNIPDITILKEMCQEYKMDLNELLEGQKKKRNKKIIFTIFGISAIIIIIFLTILLFHKNDNDFTFNELSTTCDNFKLYGTIAYNENKTSIHISNISYCGENDENKYVEINCTVYESDDTTKTKISSYTYQEEEPISLEVLLNKIDFNVDHYSKTCKMYKENGLYLEIEAKTEEGKSTFYKIPLKLEENCNN